MNLLAAQRQAVRSNAATTAEFDLVSRAGRGHCRFIDADMGIFTMLTKNGRTLDSPITLLVGHLADDDGFSVENFVVPSQTDSDLLKRMAREIIITTFQSWRQPPILLPPDSVIDEALDKIFKLLEGEPE